MSASDAATLVEPPADAPVSDAVGLFPLPVSPIERYFLDISTPARPMSVTADMVFDGTFDRERFAAGFNGAVDRHPLLRAVIDRAGGRPVWRATTDRPQLIFTENAGLSDELARFDIEREPGFRVLVDQGLQTSFSLQAHHAVCDGQGLRQLCWELMLAYERAGSAASQPRLDPLLLRTRGVLTPPLKAAPISHRERLRNSLDFFRIRAAPLRPSPQAGGPDGTYAIRRTLPAGPILAFKDRLAREGLSPNDAATALLFQLIAEHNAGRGRHYRILIPVDLRSAADARMPATNRLGFAFLTRRAADCQDLPTLMRGVRGEMEYVKDRGVAADFVHSLAACDNGWWWLMRRISLSGQFAPTVLFSDLGDATRRFRKFAKVEGGDPVVGELKFHAYFGTSPLPPGTALSICMGRYSNRYFFSFASSPRVMDRAAAETFADRFLERIADWAAG